MPSHRRETPGERREGGSRRRGPSTPRSREARRAAAAQVIESYTYLRESCPLLPQSGRLPKYHILRGAADQMQALRFENISLRWTVTACMEDREREAGPQAPRPGGQSALPQDQVRREEGERRGDDLQIVEVRGNCQWPATLPHQAQDRRQLPEIGDEIARLREVVARLRGGETRDHQPETRGHQPETRGHQPETRVHQPEATRASTGGGGVGGIEHEDEGMEVRVVWGGTVENPVPIVPHPTPRMPSSPPFPTRSWMARPVGRKIQVGSSTLQRIVRTTPVSQTSDRSTTLQIPIRTLDETEEDDMLPIDLSNRIPTVLETSREDVRTTGPPPLVPIEKWPTCPLPSSSQTREDEPPTHGIAQILKAAVIIERTRLADLDPMMGGMEAGEVRNMPILEENEKDTGVETTPTRDEVGSPESNVMWVDTPTLVIDLEAPPVTKPGPPTPFTTTSASTTGTSTSRAVLRVAKWVGNTGGTSANQQEMEGDVNLEVRGDKVDGSVRGNTSSTEGGPEVGREDVQTQHDVLGSEEMEVEEEIDVGGPETMSGEEIPGLVSVLSLGEYVEPVRTDDEEPSLVPVLSLGEYVEPVMTDDGEPSLVSVLSLGEYVESVDEKEMLRSLFEEPPNESVVPRWPRHLVSHHGEVLGDDDLNPVVNPPSPVEAIVESVCIDVVPNIEIRHQTISNDIESEVETPTSEDPVKELNDEIASDEEIAMSLERDSEGDGGDELNDEIISDEELAMSFEKDSEGEGGESVRETSAEGGTIPFRNAYVALRRLKIRKRKIQEKTSRKKKEQKWRFERDRDWKPPRRKKVKITPKIKLIRTRPISEDEESTEPRDRQSRLKRVWKGTNFKIQDEIITFYQTVPKKKMREGRKKQRRRRREEEQGRYGGFVITLPGAGRSSVSGRQYRRRDLDSGVWESELGGGQLNGSERLEIDLKTKEDEEQEDRQDGNMEEGGLGQGAVGTDPKMAMGEDTEEKSRSKRSPSPEKEIGLGGDEGAKEDVPEKETTTADSDQKGSRAEEDPRRDNRATTEGEDAEKVKANQCPGSTTSTTTIRVSNSAAPISGVQDLLRTWVEAGVHGIDCEVRIKSAELPPRLPDPAVHRGKSMR